LTENKWLYNERKAVPLREPLFCIIFSHASCPQVCERHQIANVGSCNNLKGKIVLPSEQESEPVLCGESYGVEDDDGQDNINAKALRWGRAFGIGL